MNKKVFIAIDTNSINKAKKIVKDTKTKKLKLVINLDWSF